MWSVKNKICVITGSTSGLGLETTKALRNEGAVLHLIVRNQARKEQLLNDFPEAKFYFADLGDLRAVKKTAKVIANDCPKIDLLVNNAGIISYDELTLTEEGIESTLTINYLSHVILCEALIPSLTHADEARIVFTGSLIHKHAIVDFDNLYHDGQYKPMKMYATSKMLLVMYSHFLGQHLEDSNINTHCVDPGAVATQISRSRGKFFNALFKVGKVFLTSVEKGSRTNIHGCLSPDLSSKTSTYLIKEKVASAHENTFDEAKWIQLENWTKAMLSKIN